MYQQPNGLWRLNPPTNITAYTLLTLPLELKRHIFSYVCEFRPLVLSQYSLTSQLTRPSDLKQLCLTSRDVRDLAVGFLYRYVKIDLGGQHDARINGLISPLNTATKHIRHMSVYLAQASSALEVRFSDEEDGDQYFEREAGSLQQMHMMVRMLLEAFPRTPFDPSGETRSKQCDTFETFTLSNVSNHHDNYADNRTHQFQANRLPDG